MNPVITIDGPAASGKSSLSRLLAQRLQWNWVSTGAFYRGLAFAALQRQIGESDESALVILATDPVWQVRMSPAETDVVYQEKLVTSAIQNEEVGAFASRISRLPRVRAALLAAQRRCADLPPGLVAEGRDCGSVVFPQAEVKFYLTATSHDRASRRALEHGLELEAVQAAHDLRDAQDSSRTHAPLAVPAGAFEIDTSGLTLAEVVNKAHEIAREKLASFL